MWSYESQSQLEFQWYRASFYSSAFGTKSNVSPLSNENFLSLTDVSKVLKKHT